VPEIGSERPGRVRFRRSGYAAGRLLLTVTAGVLIVLLLSTIALPGNHLVALGLRSVVAVGHSTLATASVPLGHWMDTLPGLWALAASCWTTRVLGRSHPSSARS